jgi:hypothetical protein
MGSIYGKKQWSKISCYCPFKLIAFSGLAISAVQIVYFGHYGSPVRLNIVFPGILWPTIRSFRTTQQSIFDKLLLADWLFWLFRTTQPSTFAKLGFTVSPFWLSLMPFRRSQPCFLPNLTFWSGHFGSHVSYYPF